MLRKYLISTEPGLITRRPAAFLLPFRVGGAHLGLYRHQQDDVVVERLRRPSGGAKAKPSTELECLLVMAASEEADFAELIDRRIELHVHQHEFAVRALDLLM